jgi:predicted secreted protein
MNRFLAAALAALILASPAAAERETLLRLSETAERLVRADELVALVQAQAMGGSAASVQEQLNRKVAGALARARAVP